MQNEYPDVEIDYAEQEELLAKQHAYEDAYAKYRKEYEAEKAAAAAAAAAEAEKPFDWDTFGANVRSAMGGTYGNEADMMPSGYLQNLPKLEDMPGNFVNTLGNARDKWIELNQKADKFRQSWQEYAKTGDKAALEQNVEQLQSAGSEYWNSLGDIASAAVGNAPRTYVRNFVAENENRKGSIMQTVAQEVQKTDVYLQYYMTDEEKMQKAREIQQELGIPAELLVTDKDAFKEALEIYNFKKKTDNAEDVWEVYPELKEVAKMDPQAAVLALHEMGSVKKTHGIIDTFLKGFGQGQDKLEYDLIQYKIISGEATDEDKKRAKELDAKIKAEQRNNQSFFADPLGYVASGIGQSMPEMLESIKEGGTDAAAMAALSVAITVATGGTGAAAIAGGTALRAAIMQAIRSQAVKNVFKAGMVWGMTKPEWGSSFAELGELKDKDGKPLLTDDERKLYSLPVGLGNAAIEMLDFGLITNALKPFPHATKVFGDIVKNATVQKTQREKLMGILGGGAKNALKIGAAESGEEALQSALEDTVHNYIVADKGATHIKSYSLGEIAARAATNAAAAFPVGVGFGLAGGSFGTAGRMGTAYRSARREEALARTYGENVRQTMTGTVMVEQLQHAVAEGKLKEKSPDVQKKILRSQLGGTGYETAYIDVETALKNEKGMEDLKKVADANGMTGEELQTAIEEKGFITVPTEVLSQVSSSPDLLDSVSFKPEADSMARIRENQKELVKQYDETLKKMEKRRQEILDTIIKDSLPNATEEQKQILNYAITANPENPAQGWNVMRKDVQEKLDEILAPAMKALRAGMGQAKTLDIKDEQGNVKTINTPGENAPWYRNFYAQFKRKPTKAELEDMAIAMVTGDPSAPKVEGWIPDSAETEAAMRENKGAIDAIKKDLAALDSVKNSVKNMTGAEMSLTSVFEPETYKAYKKISGFLQSVGGSTARQARAAAILSATHAQIIAKRISKLTGKKYTAEDYVNEKLEFTIRPLQEGLEQMAGVKANTANIEQLKIAQEMFDEGIDMENIYDETGWLRGADGKWRFEIPDNLDKINWQAVKEKQNGYATLWQVYDNEKLYEAYPMLASVPVKLVDTAEGNNGRVTGNIYRVIEINRNLSDEEKGETLIHEIQHLIQEKEGFATGGNIQQVRQQIQKQIDSLRRKLAGIPQANEYIRVSNEFFSAIENGSQEDMDKAWEEQARLEEEIPEKTRNEIDSLSLQLNNLEKVIQDETDDYRLYRNLAGEQEARSTATRAAYMTEYRQAVQEQTKAQLAYEREVKKQPREMVEKLRELQQLENKIGNVITDEEEARLEQLRQEIDPALLEAYDERDSANWIAEDKAEYLNTPIPHNENAIIVFDGQEMAMSLIPDIDLDQQVNVMDFESMTNDLSGKTNAEVVDYINKMDKTPIPTADLKAMLGIPAGDEFYDTYGRIHIVRGNLAMSTKNKRPRNIVLSNFADVVRNAVLVDIERNNEKKLPEEVPRKNRRVQKRKNDVAYYYRFMLPIKINGKIKTLIMEAEEREGEAHLRPYNTTLYEIFYAKKDSQSSPVALAAEPVAITERVGNPNTVSIREILMGVKDSEGNLYLDQNGNINRQTAEIVNQSAWHGTPHNFNAFDLGAIGTGEGAQAHGWGLYFAENRSISEAYKNKLSKGVIIDGQSYKTAPWDRLVIMEDGSTTNDGVIYKAVKALEENESKEAAIEYLKKKSKSGLKKLASESEKAIEFLQGKGVKLDKGNLFEVEIPDNDVLLDEQKPLNEQSDNVTKSIMKYYASRPDYYGEVKNREQLPKTTGRDFYKDVVFQMQREGVPQIEAAKVASQLLNEMGIKGITYEGGRDGRCYVVFDDQAISIIEKYNQEINSGNYIKGQTAIRNGKRVVSIMEHAADESTFMHEMAHVFLYDLMELAPIDEESRQELEVVTEWGQWHKGDARKYYSNTPWAKEFAAREQAIIDAEEHGDQDEADWQKRIWIQERFARGFELYLMEGQAPSSRLKAVFRKFKQFLTRLYSVFINDGARASEPVKRVMDRMVATEEEIKAAELEDRYNDFSKAGGEKLFDETDAETYERWYAECEEDAKEKLLKIVMKDLEKKRQEEFDTKVALEEERKRGELQQENVYVAERAVLASGDENIVLNWYPSVEAFREELAVTPPMEEVLDKHIQEYRDKLDAELINSHLSPEAVDKVMDTEKNRNKLEQLKSKAMAKKAGLINQINAKAARAMESLEDKLNALPDDMDLKMDADKPQIKSIMKEINKLRYASKWNKEELGHIESMIRAATQQDMKQALKEFKEKAKENKAQEDAVMKANEGRRHIFRELAKQAAANKPISDSCNVNFYKQEAKKAAKRVKSMVKAKRWDMALMAQEQSGLYTAMVEIAEKNKETMEKLRGQVARELTARTVRLPKDERYWHRQLAYILRLTPKEPQKPESGVKSLNELFSEYVDSLDVKESPVKVLEIASKGENFQGYQSLTLEQFKEAVDVIHMIYKVGKYKFKLKTIENKTIQEAVDDIRNEDSMANHSMVDAKKVNDDRGGIAYNELIGNTGTVGHLLAKQGQNYILSNLKPENIINMLGSFAHRYLYGTLERSAEKEAKLQEENIKALREIMGVYTRKECQEWSKKLYEFSTEGTDKISKENIFAMALNWGTLSNRQRLLGGLAENRSPEAVGAITKEVIELFQATMTEKDWLTVQRLWDHAESYWDMTTKVEEELNGVALEKIPPMPFTIQTADGKTVELAGGYMEIKYNPEKSSKAAEQDINKAMQTGMAGAQRMGAGRGFTKSRSEQDIFRALRLDWSVIENHFQDVIHNATYRIPVRDVYRIITNLDFENHVVDHLGREAHNILKEWALDCWKQDLSSNNTADNFLSRALSWFRSNSTMAIMGCRLWSVIENTSNIAIAIDKIGPAQFAAALANFYANPKESMAKVKNMSIFMRNRLENMDRDIRQQTGIFRAKNRIAEFASQHAYDLMVYSDLMVSAPLWLRSYRNAYAPSLQTVKKENEANIAYVMQCQQELDAIKAQIADLTNETSQMNAHLQAQRYASPETAESLRQSPFAIHSDNNLRALAGENQKKIKSLEKDLFEAEVKFQEAREIKILTDDEILAETEQRAVYAADAAIRDTFGSGRVMDQATVQRSKNELTKLLTTFYSFFNTQFNALFMAYTKSRTMPDANAIARWMPFAKAVMLRVVGTALIGSTLQFALGLAGNDDDDKKRKVKDAEGKTVEEDISAYERFMKVFAKNTISTSVGSMYFVRDVANVVSDFVIKGKSYGLNTGSVATRSISEFGKMFSLLAKKGEKDADIQAKAEAKEKKHQEKLKKLKGKKRQEYLKKWEEDQKYQKPPKRITYAEIAGHGLKGLSGMTANYTGLTSTLVNAITGTMQYLTDTDMRYDATMKNIIWSALFDKHPVEREVPKKPAAEPKKKKKKSKAE